LATSVRFDQSISTSLGRTVSPHDVVVEVDEPILRYAGGCVGRPFDITVVLE